MIDVSELFAILFDIKETSYLPNANKVKFPESIQPFIREGGGGRGSLDFNFGRVLFGMVVHMYV